MRYKATDITGIGDPYILNVDGTYYLYATSSKEGICVWKGKCLDNLKKLGLCYLKEESFGYVDFWAPEVVRRSDGKFVMHLTARDRTDGVLRTGVAVSDSPEGIFRDVYPNSPMFRTDTATIDASCFIDDDKKAYLYFVKDCSNNIIDGIHTSQIYVSRLNDDLTALEGEAILIASPDKEWECRSLPAPCVSLLGHGQWAGGEEAFMWNEGPSVIKVNGKYYMTYSANCFDNRDYSVGVAVSDSPLGPFVKYDKPVMKYIADKLSGPGHNSFFKDNAGRLMCAFHCHTDYNAPSGDRRFCYCEVEFDDGVLKLMYI